MLVMSETCNLRLRLLPLLPLLLLPLAREAHAELQLVREEVSYIAGLLDTCKAELAAGFEEWYAATYGQQAQVSVCWKVHVAASCLPLLRPSRQDTEHTVSFVMCPVCCHMRAGAARVRLLPASQPARLQLQHTQCQCRQQ